MTGYSFGGYVTCRVAAHESRIVALAPDGPIIDLFEATVAFQGNLLDTVKKLPRFAVTLPGRLMLKKMSRTPVLLAFKQYTDWTEGMYSATLDPIDKLEAGIRFLEPFTVEDDLNSISAAAMALVSEGDGEVLINQAQRSVKGMSSGTKKLHLFTMSEDGSDDHC